MGSLCNSQKRLYGTGWEVFVAYSWWLMERRAGYAVKPSPK
jgi:hypothetical protein